MIFFNFFDVYMPIMYKIRLIKAQALKSYRTVVIQESYGSRAFLLPSQSRVINVRLFLKTTF